MATGKPASKRSRNGSGNGVEDYSLSYEGKRAEVEILQGLVAEPEYLGSVGQSHINKLYFAENAALLRNLLHDDATRALCRLTEPSDSMPTGHLARKDRPAARSPAGS